MKFYDLGAICGAVGSLSGTKYLSVKDSPFAFNGDSRNLLLRVSHTDTYAFNGMQKTPV